MAKYLTQVDTENEGTLIIRDPEVWQYINTVGGQLEVVVVDTLPTADATTYGKIYLTNEAGVGTSNSYDEYVTKRAGSPGAYTYSWEKIGTTDLNMAGYSAKGHVHPVDTNVSVDDHDYTPQGTVNVTLKYTGTQAVEGSTTAQGTVTLTVLDHDDAAATAFTPKGSIVGPVVNGVAEATPYAEQGSTPATGGDHKHAIGKTKKYMKAVDQSFLTGVTPTKQKLQTDTMQNFESTTDDAHKAAHIDKAKDISIARVTGDDTSVPTVDDTQEADFTTTPATSPFVTGLAVPGSGETADVLVQAEATVIVGEGDANNPHYRLSFAGKKLATGNAITGVTHAWNGNTKPLKKSAFGSKDIPTVANYTESDMADLIADSVTPTDAAGITAALLDAANLDKAYRLTSEFTVSSSNMAWFAANEVTENGKIATDTCLLVANAGTDENPSYVFHVLNHDYQFSHKKFGTAIQVPAQNGSKTFATGAVGSTGSGANVMTAVTPASGTISNYLKYTGSLPDGLALQQYVGMDGRQHDLTLSAVWQHRRVVAEVQAADGFGGTLLAFSRSHIVGCAGDKWNDTDVASNVRSQVEWTVEPSGSVARTSLRARAYDTANKAWGDWSRPYEQTAGDDEMGAIVLSGGFAGNIYGVEVYDSETDELLFKGIPAVGADPVAAGLWDNVADTMHDGYIDCRYPIKESMDGDIPFYDHVDGATGDNGAHRHDVAASFQGTTEWLKPTFQGQQSAVTGTTPKAEVDTQTFTGTQANLRHTVHNPRVYSGVDDWDEGNRLGDWYGITYDENVADPQKTRIGNMTMHKTLPIQSRMRRCLLMDDGTVYNYLDKDDSRYYANGSKDMAGNDIGGQLAELGGTAYSTYGDSTSAPFNVQVMVEIPHHWRKVMKDANDVVTAMISPYEQEGWIEVPTYYVGAFEANIDSNSKMRSAAGNFYPTRNTTLADFRTAARKRHQTLADGTTPDYRWNILPWLYYVDLYWLYVIEYANTNSQKAFNDELTSDGYRQGGLGEGCTNCTSATYDVCKCGCTADGSIQSPSDTSSDTDNLGNNSGYVTIAKPSGQTGNTYPVSYRGIENIFGSVWTILDGICFADTVVYICPNPAHYATIGAGGQVTVDTSKYTQLSEAKLQAGIGTQTVKKMLIGSDGVGHILPVETTTSVGMDYHYCDGYWGYDATYGGAYQMAVVGGSAHNGTLAGLASVASRRSVAALLASFGSRLCFLPNANDN